MDDLPRRDYALHDGQLDWLRRLHPCLLDQARSYSTGVTGPRLVDGRMVTILRGMWERVADQLTETLRGICYDYLLVDLERTREPGWISLWRPNSWGYTFQVGEAGSYSEWESRKVVDGAGGNEIALPSWAAAGMYDHCIGRIHTNWLPMIRSHPDSITYPCERIAEEQPCTDI